MWAVYPDKVMCSVRWSVSGRETIPTGNDEIAGDSVCKEENGQLNSGTDGIYIRGVKRRICVKKKVRKYRTGIACSTF